MLIRRVVPAIVATLAAYTGLAVAAGLYLRQHYLTPLLVKNAERARLRLDHQPVVDPRAASRSASPCSARSSRGRRSCRPGRAGHPAGDPSRAQYLAQHGYTQWTTYQPASRFWPFQWIEGGWLLALSVLLIAATVWLVRRRAA